MESMETKENKVLITGTGRTGTTILVKILSLLKLDTGFQDMDEEEMSLHINSKTNGGLEKYLNRPAESYPVIVKAPQFWDKLYSISLKYNVKRVYVPIRELTESAKSREKNGKEPGGLWEAKDLESQINHNAKVIYQIVYDCTTYDIPVKFIDFKRLVHNLDYAFSICQMIAQDSGTSINLQEFTEVYLKVIDHNKITTK